MARASDIETLCRLRNYDVKGYRNSLLHCYAYWKGIYIRDMEALSSIVYELNDRFIEPLKQSEVDAMIRSVDRAIEKFIDYEQGIRSGEDKRVSRKMKERGGYWYTNETLIDMLDITEEEQRHLKTIIGTNEKYRRNNIRRRKERRNEAGLTMREQQKKDNIKAVKELAAKGLNQSEIAKEVGLHQSNVSRILNNKY
jgi:DNA-directed RNA polymerase specialized sigma54-like protein